MYICHISLRPELFLQLIYEPSYFNFFRKVEKKIISKIIFILYPPTLNIICFVEINKKNFF